MPEQPPPEWFALAEMANPKTMKRIADVVAGVQLPLQVKNLPMQAHWFVLDSLLLANRANREGMHANALALTRQSIEAISVLEVGLCGHKDSANILGQWDSDRLTPGAIRRWLSENVWTAYGSGLWSESWADFMGNLARAVQPYAHYSAQLAKWQTRLHLIEESDAGWTAVKQLSPRAYDPQKATRITLFHALLMFALGRIWMAQANGADPGFSSLMNRLRLALGKSKYLDGHQTDWDQQFWPFVWSTDGGTILE